ncbi:glutamyl-tRNA amidotransferase, partial [Litorilinea aerophila]
MKSKLQALTVHEALQGLAAGDFTSVQLTEACLAQIEAVDGQIRAFLQVTAEQALAQAEAADRRRAAGETAPLLGIPLAIKDVLATRGVETTCG